MKAYFSEKQKRLIEESLNLENSAKTLPSHILTDLESAPLNASPAFLDGFLKRACAKRYQQVKSEFLDDIESYNINDVLARLSKLTIKCIKKEERIHTQLERICLDAVSEFLKVPQDGVKIECHLQNEIDSHTQFHIQPDTDEDMEYDSLEQIEGNDSDTQKRYLLNAVIMGAALSLSNDIVKKTLNAIFELDEELPHLYSQIMKINDYLLFRANFKIEDNNHKQGGYVIVKLGSDITPTSIESYGVIFPILLIETIRGCMELFISHGLPDDMQAARAVINKADALENDPWNTRIGPILWDYISSAVEDEDYNISSFLMNLSSLDNTEFFNIMKELYANTRLGKNIIKKIAHDSKYEDDYTDFQSDLQKKQKDLIEDDYFSEEELNG